MRATYSIPPDKTNTNFTHRGRNIKKQNRGKKDKSGKKKEIETNTRESSLERSLALKRRSLGCVTKFLLRWLESAFDDESNDDQQDQENDKHSPDPH